MAMELDGVVVDFDRPADLLDVLRAVRNRIRFGENIGQVHTYLLTREDTDTAQLRIQYSDWVQCPQKTLVISYIYERGGWKIDAVTHMGRSKEVLSTVTDLFALPKVLTVPKCPGHVDHE